MKIVTGEEMRLLDSRTIREIGIPGIVLMENAGRAVGEKAKEILGTVKGKRIYVFAGKGNNGGDAFVAARYLHNWGAKVKVFMVDTVEKLQGDARVNGEILLRIGVPTALLTEGREIKKLRYSIAFSDLLIDGLLGTGATKAVKGVIEETIELINQSMKTVVAIDLPSGVDSDTGQILGRAVQAQYTVTMALPKRGVVVYPGKQYVGELTVADISISTGNLIDHSYRVTLTTAEEVVSILPSRPLDSYKGDYGKAFILAGSPGMTGAAYLTSEACLAAGAGLVKLGLPFGLNGLMEVKTTEVMTKPLPQTEKGLLSISSLSLIEEEFEGIDGLAIGPGLGRSDEVTEVVWELIRRSPVPLVVDADGLFALSEGIDILLEAKAPIILTPHLGELAQLSGMTVEQLKNDPIGNCQRLAEEWGVYLVMKGASTIISSPQGKVHVNPTGNPGMATGGTGDVLTGLITSFVVQGLDPYQAAVAGVYLHGLAGDLAAVDRGMPGLVAGDLIRLLPTAWAVCNDIQE